MGEKTKSGLGGISRRFETTESDSEQTWHYRNSSSDSIRITDLKEDTDVSNALPSIGDSDPDIGTDPDIKQRVGFGETVPAPIDSLASDSSSSSSVSLSTNGAVATVLGALRDRSRVAPTTGSMIAGRYRVIRILGQGGMGTVYEVSHARLGKSFALKLLRHDVASDQSTRNNFFREAKFTSSLSHQNLISVLDFDEDPDFGPYIVMELASGVLLTQYLHKRSKLQIKRACDIVLQIANALAYIHDQNLIHCDLKPQNVMLVPTEKDARKTYVVKLLDFGLAQSRGAPSQDAIFGTPRYLSPEIALCEPASPLSDVYSLGILFFELLTGRAPFEGNTKQLLQAHIRDQPPSIAAIRGQEVDPALEQLIATALSKFPDDRQRSMSAFIYELKNFMQMSGMTLGRSTQVTMSPVKAEVSDRAQLASASYDALRLPLATVAVDGVIVAANAAFSKFVLGMRIGIEGSNLHDSALAPAWTSISRDIEAACNGVSIGRRVEIDLRSGEVVTLQMWLEPTNRSGFAVLSLYPER